MGRVSSLLLLIALVVGVSSCAGRVTPEEFDRAYGLLLGSAQQELAQGNTLKAYVIADQLLNADPSNGEAFEVKSAALRADGDLDRFERRGFLGSNMQVRESRNAGVLTKIVAWPLNVVLDLLDVITVEVGGTIGAGVKAQATEALAVGVQFSGGQTVFGFRNRNLGTRLTVEQYVDLLIFEIRTLAEAQFNTGGGKSLTFDGTGFKQPGDAPYQTVRDYWAVGVEAEIGILALNLKIHPVQVIDWVGTIFFFDMLNDNVGSTRGVNFDSDEKEAFKRLMKY